MLIESQSIINRHISKNDLISLLNDIYHHSSDQMISTFSTFLTLQQACQLGVSVRNKSIFLAFIPKGTDHITQRQKAAIDADACGGNKSLR